MKLTKKTALTLFFMAAGIVLLYWALENPVAIGGVFNKIFGLLFPFILGFCIAFVLNLPMRLLEKILFPNTKNKILSAARRPLCIVLALVIIGLIVVFIVQLVVPELYNAVLVLAKEMPAFIDNVSVWANQQIPLLGTWLDSMNIAIDWPAISKSLISYASAGATSILGGTMSFITQLVGGVFNFIIAFIVAIYLLSGKEKFKSQACALLHAFLPARVYSKVLKVCRLVDETFSHFISGQCIEACILGSLCWIGMMIFCFPYATMISVMLGAFALIPIVGAFLSFAIGAFMIAMVNPMQALWFVVFVLTLQQVEGNLIYPRVVGTSVGLPGLWVLVAITVGGGLFGIGGVLFSVPFASVIYKLLREYVHYRSQVKTQT